jgi:hypothetical protein
MFLIAVVSMLVGCASDSGREAALIIPLPDTSAISVFDLLRSDHEVEYDSSSSGVFVKSIDSTPNTRSAYWLYFVNDTAATMASDKYMLRGGEKVEWRYISGY